MKFLLPFASSRPGYMPKSSNSPRACIDCGDSCGPGRPGRRCKVCRELYSIDELRIRANRMGITCRQASDLLDNMLSGNVILRHEPPGRDQSLAEFALQRTRFREHCIEMVSQGRVAQLRPIGLADEHLLVREQVLVGEDEELRGEFYLYTSLLLTFRCIPGGADDGSERV